MTPATRTDVFVEEIKFFQLGLYELSNDKIIILLAMLDHNLDNHLVARSCNKMLLVRSSSILFYTVKLTLLTVCRIRYSSIAFRS